jgi:hypothetical protein
MIRPMAARNQRATMIPAIILNANHGHCTNLDSKSVFNFSDLSDNGNHCNYTTNKNSLWNPKTSSLSLPPFIGLMTSYGVSVVYACHKDNFISLRKSCGRP